MIPPTLLPDGYLIYKIQRGDNDAFAVLYSRHVRRVFGLLYRLCGSVEVTEDLTQETFIAAFRSLPTFQNRSSFATWVCRVALNTHRDHLRATKRQPETELLEDAETVAGLRTDDPLRSVRSGKPTSHWSRRYKTCQPPHARPSCWSVSRGFPTRKLPTILKSPSEPYNRA